MAAHACKLPTPSAKTASLFRLSDLRTTVQFRKGGRGYEDENSRSRRQQQEPGITSFVSGMVQMAAVIALNFPRGCPPLELVATRRSAAAPALDLHPRGLLGVCTVLSCALPQCSPGPARRRPGTGPPVLREVLHVEQRRRLAHLIVLSLPKGRTA